MRPRAVLPPIVSLYGTFCAPRVLVMTDDLRTAPSSTPSEAPTGGCGGCAKKLINGKTAEEWSHICMNVCGGRCCRHVAWAIPAPKTREDFDRMRISLLHPLVSFFKEDGEWFLQIQTVCEKLLPNNGCGIYATRPQICRDYEAGACEWPDGVDYEVRLDNDNDLQSYLDERFHRTERPGEPLNHHLRVDVVVWPIDPPRDKEDYDFMRWGVLHKEVRFFREKRKWFLLIGRAESLETIDTSRFEVYIDSEDALVAHRDRRTKVRRQKKAATPAQVATASKSGKTTS